MNTPPVACSPSNQSGICVFESADKQLAPHLLTVESFDAVNNLASSLELARALTPAQCCVAVHQLGHFVKSRLR